METPSAKLFVGLNRENNRIENLHAIALQAHATWNKKNANF